MAIKLGKTVNGLISLLGEVRNSAEESERKSIDNEIKSVIYEGYTKPVYDIEKAIVQEDIIEELATNTTGIIDLVINKNGEAVIVGHDYNEKKDEIRLRGVSAVRQEIIWNPLMDNISNLMFKLGEALTDKQNISYRMKEHGVLKEVRVDVTHKFTGERQNIQLSLMIIPINQYQNTKALKIDWAIQEVLTISDSKPLGNTLKEVIKIIGDVRNKAVLCVQEAIDSTIKAKVYGEVAIGRMKQHIDYIDNVVIEDNIIRLFMDIPKDKVNQKEIEINTRDHSDKQHKKYDVAERFIREDLAVNASELHGIPKIEDIEEILSAKKSLATLAIMNDDSSMVGDNNKVYCELQSRSKEYIKLSQCMNIRDELIAQVKSGELQVEKDFSEYIEDVYFRFRDKADDSITMDILYVGTDEEGCYSVEKTYKCEIRK